MSSVHKVVHLAIRATATTIESYTEKPYLSAGARPTSCVYSVKSSTGHRARMPSRKCAASSQFSPALRRQLTIASFRT